MDTSCGDVAEIKYFHGWKEFMRKEDCPYVHGGRRHSSSGPGLSLYYLMAPDTGPPACRMDHD